MPDETTPPDPRWFCLRTEIKREHIAQAHLRQLAGVESFCPRVRYQKLTRRGRKWFVEAMFPNYLFARFDWVTEKRLVQSAQGVAGVVHFGTFFPALEDAIIAELKAQLDDSDLKEFPDEVMPGDDIEVTAGPFMGLRAVVTRLLPSRARVKVLLEFLGKPREVEVAQESVLKVPEAGSETAILTRRK